MLPLINPATRGALAGFVVLGSVCRCDAELPERMVAKLGSDKFAERQQAEADLLDWARRNRRQSMQSLLKAVREADDPEVGQRCFSVLKELVYDQYFEEGEGYLGISMLEKKVEVPGDGRNRQGIQITQIAKGSPAERSKALAVGDRVVALNGRVWRKQGMEPAFREAVRTSKPGSVALLTILRNEALVEVPVVLGVRPVDSRRLQTVPLADGEDAEQAAREAYFRRWLAEREISR